MNSNPTLDHSHDTSHSVKYRPSEAKYFDQINALFNFTPEELALLARNGFLLTDRIVFEQFKRSYAYIYWKDLPVFVTTDSILHALHQTYDEMFKRVEMNILTEKLIQFLSRTRESLSALAYHDERLKPYLADLDTYLAVPLILLDPQSQDQDLHEKLAIYLQPMMDVNSYDYHHGRKRHTRENGKRVQIDMPEIGYQPMRFFGLERDIDFTQFQARGHYDEPTEIMHYFMAMMWLALIDFRFVDFDDADQPRLNVGQLIAAHLLRDAVQAADQRENWQNVDDLLTAFVGWSDNITLNGLDQFITDANIQSPTGYFDVDHNRLMDILMTRDYGQQHIRGQIQNAFHDPDAVALHVISFMLMGQRFTVESMIMQQLVYDKLVVDGVNIPRAYPQALDVMATLGNDRALDHLSSEFARFGYRSRLLELRQQVQTFSHEFWESNFYNLWLNAICALNAPVNPEQPAAMQSPAWADKTLHTQLASWTQLRHDNILYVKPPYSPRSVCEYPAGYVEPCPEFFRSLSKYARFGRDLFQNLIVDTTLPMTYEEAEAEAKKDWRTRSVKMRPYEAVHLRDTLLMYFDKLEVVASRLEDLSRKELARIAFSEEDTLFLRSIVVRKHVGETHYGGLTEEDWDGWYNDLLPFGDETAQLVTDIYTNINEKLDRPGVLHLGTGDPALMVLLLESEQGQRMYVGPGFTWFEHLEIGMPPHRLDDEDWFRLRRPISEHRKSLEEIKIYRDNEQRQEGQESLWDERIQEHESAIANYPRPPAWTQSFRISSDASQKRALIKYVIELINLDFALTRQILQTLNLGQFGDVDAFVALVQKDPSALLQVEGMNEQLLAQILQNMRNHGF